jgi:hypothetical protein
MGLPSLGMSAPLLSAPSKPEATRQIDGSRWKEVFAAQMIGDGNCSGRRRAWIRGCMDSVPASAATPTPTAVQAVPPTEPQENDRAVGSPKLQRHRQSK